MIRGFVGANGAGKTCCMVEEMAIRSWRAGRVVCANFTLRPELIGYSPSLFIPLKSWKLIPMLGDHSHCKDDGLCPCRGDRSYSITGNVPATLLLDEVTTIFSSRQSMQLPVELQAMLTQFRKPDVWVGWSAPAWARADLMLRECTMQVTLCTGRFPDRWIRESGFVKKPRLNAKRVKKDPSGWPSRRLFQWRTFDAFEFEEFSLDRALLDHTESARALKPLKSRLVWRPWLEEAMQVYDTREGVQMMDNVWRGECQTCGLKKSQQTCKGHGGEEEGPVPIGDLLARLREGLRPPADQWVVERPTPRANGFVL